MILDDLLARVVQACTVLDSLGFRPILVGGLAVHTWKTLSSSPDSEESALATRPRVTQDIDLVVFGDSSGAIAALVSRCGMTRAGREPVVRDHGIEIDVLDGILRAGAAPEVTQLRETLEFVLPEEAVTTLSVGDATIRVASLPALVCTKARAVLEPARGKSGSDLADIASLALIESVAPSGAEAMLERWKPAMSAQMLAALVHARAQFESPTSRGSLSFVSNVVERPLISDEEESRAAELASDAVRRLLRSFR